MLQKYKNDVDVNERVVQFQNRIVNSANAFFDKQPKFLRYRPDIAVLTSIELDHIEVFPDLASLQEVFRAFLRLLPADGRLIACDDDAGVVETVPDDLAAPVT